jgi:tetratricopeptide (TPR) repeat protein
MLRALGRHDQAIPAYQKEIEHWRRLARENREVPLFRGRLYSSCLELARFLIAEGRKPEAAEWFGLAGRALADQPRKTGGDLYNLACVHAQAAAAIGDPQGNLTVEESRERDRLMAAAIDALRQSIEVVSQTAAHILADDDLAILRGRADFQALVAWQESNEAAAGRSPREGSGTPEEKLKAQQKALAAQAKKASDEARGRHHRADLAASQQAVGLVLTDLGRFGEGEKTLKEALDARRGLAQEQPDNVRSRLDVGWSHLALAAIPWKTLRLEEADREWSAGLRAMDAALRAWPDDGLLQSELDNAWTDIALKLLRLGLWQEARENLDRVYQRNPRSLAQADGHPWHLHALLQLLAGDQAGFRASCTDFFREFRARDNKSNLYRACLAGVEVLPHPDLKFLAETAEKDLGRNPKNNWFLVFAAMTRARAGDHRRALELLDQTRPEYSPATNLAGARAIILHHQSRGDEARKVLAAAALDLEDTYRGLLSGVLPMSITDAETLILREVLHREAHALIDGKPAPDGPYRLLVRARVLGHRGRDAEFEKTLIAAMAARPGDPQVLAAKSRILAEMDRSRTGKPGFP